MGNKNNKISDEGIISIKLKAINGVTIKESCKEAGISPQTFFRRYREINKTKEESELTLLDTADDVIITIQRLDQAAKDTLDYLEDMVKTGKGYDLDKHDALDVIRTTISLITGYRSALQKANILVDNRQVNITVEVKGELFEEWWREIVDPALSEIGVSRDNIIRAATVIDAKWKDVQ